MRRFYLFLLLIVSGSFLAAQCTTPESGELVVTPPLPANGYPQGTVVNMCFTINNFNPVVINWLHSIIPTFGSGWDVSTLTPVSSANACQPATGSWSFYNSWTSCATGQTYGPGFAFDGILNVGCGGSGNDGDPGNNWGDQGNCAREFCWTIEAGANPNSGCSAGDYQVQVLVYGDAESGNYNPPGGPPCQNDPPLCWPELTNFGASVDMPCPGDDFTLTGIADGVPCGSTIMWTGPGGFTSTDLITTNDAEGPYTLTVSTTGCAEYTETVNATYGIFNPVLTPSPTGTFCEGETVTLSVTGGNSFNFINPSGSSEQNGSSNTYTFPADMNDAGTWMVEVTGGSGGCQVDLMTTLIINPAPTVAATANPDPVCTGDEVTFTVTNPNITYTYTWGGGVAAGETYTITAGPPGAQTMQLEACTLDGCCETIQVPYTVLGLPNVTVSANPTMICEGDQVTLTATGGVTYVWDPDPTNTSGSVLVDSPTMTTTYSVTATDGGGCMGEAMVTVDVQEELAAPVITCTSNTAATLDFDWPLVPGADYYEYTIDGGPVMTTTSPPVMLTGLDPLQMVTIVVTAFSNNNPACPGISTTETCQVRDCDPVTINIDPIDPICADGSNDLVTLIAGAPGAGPGQIIWSGPGVVNPNNPGSFLPSILSAGTYTLTATFTLFDGSCPFEETIDVEILDGASADIDASADEVCIDQTVTVELADPEVIGATYTWDFGGATVESGSGNAGPYELSFPSAGDYTVSLETLNGQCTDMDEITIMVSDTLDPLVVVCQSVTNSSVIFGWNDNGADSYTVTVISGPMGTQNGNNYEITGLNNGDFVSIQVTANTGGLCPSVTSNVQECQAISCPDVTITIDQPAQNFCGDGMNAPLDLTATVTGAMNPSAITWSGPGVSGSTFDADDAGPGTHTVTASVEDDGCPFTTTVVFTVTAPPTSDFTLNPSPVCTDQSVSITYTGDADQATATFNWDFDGGTIVSGTGAGPYEISWPSGGSYNVSLTVTDAGGCAGTETIQPAEVQNPLMAPVVECINLAIDMATFQWADVPGATGYDVVLISGPAGTQMGNTYTVTGLAEGDQVTIQVTALGAPPCGNSAPTEATCAAQTCPAITINIDNPPASFCQDGSGTFEFLTATTAGGMQNGTFSWSGPGVSNDTFFVDQANLGANTVMVTYEEGGCSYDSSVVFTLNPVPTAIFTIDPDTVCVDQPVTVTYQGSAGAGATYDWNFGGATVLSGTAAGPYTLSGPSAGNFLVQLQVTENGCPSVVELDSFQVEAPLATPNPSCVNTDLDQVTFGWNAVAGADSFQVTILPAGTTFFQDSLTYFVGGLMEGESITIEVIALGSGVCGNSEIGSFSCAAATCPPLFVTPTPAATDFCLGDGSSALLLSALTGGGAGGGTLVWTGNGVSENGGDYFFDDEVSGLGTHWVFVTYTEGGCEVTDSVEMMVFAIPTAQITETNDETEFCNSATIVLAYQGSAGPGATYDWDFDGASTVNQPDPTMEVYELTYATAGNYTVTLTVTEDGCSSAEASYNLAISEPLGSVAASCGLSDLNQVTVDWVHTVPGASYQIMVGGVIVDTVTTFSYTQSGLTPGETVMFTITPLLAGNPCGDGTPVDISCQAEACPNLSIDLPSAPVPVCFDDDPLNLIATINNGSGGTIVWSGPGVTANTFDPAAAGVGLHTLIIDYVENGPCTLQDSFQIEVLPLPTADFSLDTDEICEGQSVTVTYDGTAMATADYDWDFGDGTVLSGSGQGPYVVSFAMAGVQTISLTVTEDGCVGPAFSDQITIVAPLADPVITCVNAGLEEVTFSWDPIPGATGYSITELAGPTSTQTGTSYTIMGLMPEQAATITVTALGDPPCGDGEPVEASCTTLACPDISVTSITPAQSFCLANNTGPVLLEATSSGGDMTGTFSWSGQGVTQIGPDFFFDPDMAGLGEWILTIDYIETAGCAGSGSLTMNVVPVPTSDFIIGSDPVCEGEVLTVTYDGTAGPNATFAWNFDGATILSGSDEGPYQISYATAGTPTISLAVTEGDCGSNESQSLTVVAPLGAPAPTCGASSLTSVTFEWPAVAGATAYAITTDLGDDETITETSYEVTGLQPGQTVTFTIVAEGPPPCGDTEAVTISCMADVCPNLTISPSAPQTTFCAGSTDQQQLSATITGGNGGEVATWSGPGVISAGPDFFFDPTGLPAGEYVLTAGYNEGGVCPYEAQLTMTVNAQPTADFSLSEDLLCENEATIVNLGGITAEGASIDWDFGTATVTDLGNDNYELTFPTPGIYSIGLTVSQNGCMDAISRELSVERAPETGVQSVVLERCPDDANPSNLFDLLSGADPGGDWSTEPGTPPGTVDPVTGQLNATSLLPGTYFYRYTINSPVCGAVSTEVAVTIQPVPLANAGNDQTLTCLMGMVSLDGSDSDSGPGYTYEWTHDNGAVITNPNDQLTEVAQGGIYTLRVTSPLGCTATDEVVVRADTEVPIPQVDLSNISCFSDNDGAIQITDVTGGTPPFTYSINGVATDNSGFFPGLQPGEYQLRVTGANGCFSELFLDVTEPDELRVSLSVTADPDDIQAGEPVTVTARVTGGNALDTLIWEPDSLNTSVGEGNSITFIADETTQIRLTVVDELGCRASDNLLVVVRKDRPIFIPSGISPNGDNINDRFIIYADDNQVEEIESFLIFNRWGESIFENYNFQPNDPAQGWDGTHRGETLNPAVFVYQALIRFTDGETILYKGDISLLR